MWLLLFMANSSHKVSVVQVGNKLHILVDILSTQFCEYLALVSVISFPTCYLSESPRIIGLGYDNQSRTLTCTFDRGPASSTSWGKNGAVINPNATYQQTMRLVDLVTGTYQIVLIIGSSVSQSDILGTYNCTVGNNRRTTSVARVVAGNGELIPYMHYLRIQY